MKGVNNVKGCLMNVQDNECKVLTGFRNLGYFRTWQSSLLLCSGNRGLVV